MIRLCSCIDYGNKARAHSDDTLFAMFEWGVSQGLTPPDSMNLAAACGVAYSRESPMEENCLWAYKVMRGYDV